MKIEKTELLHVLAGMCTYITDEKTGDTSNVLIYEEEGHVHFHSKYDMLSSIELKMTGGEEQFEPVNANLYSLFSLVDSLDGIINLQSGGAGLIVQSFWNDEIEKYEVAVMLPDSGKFESIELGENKGKLTLNPMHFSSLLHEFGTYENSDSSFTIRKNETDDVITFTNDDDELRTDLWFESTDGVALELGDINNVSVPFSFIKSVYSNIMFTLDPIEISIHEFGLSYERDGFKIQTPHIIEEEYDSDEPACESAVVFEVELMVSALYVASNLNKIRPDSANYKIVVDKENDQVDLVCDNNSDLGKFRTNCVIGGSADMDTVIKNVNVDRMLSLMKKTGMKYMRIEKTIQESEYAYRIRYKNAVLIKHMYFKG
jgi:hypothetical protein